MSSLTRQQLEKWLKTLEFPYQKGFKILDIGGSQNPIGPRIGQFGGTLNDILILDLEKPHEEKRKANFVWDINLEMTEMHKSNSYDNPAYAEEEFDVVFCIEVSEYLWNPIVALKNINHLLKQNGILYMSFHFIYPQHNPVQEDCLRYTPAGVSRLMSETGFLIEEMKMRTMGDEGNAFFYQFMSQEKMRPANMVNHDIIGCLVKAKKI